MVFVALEQRVLKSTQSRFTQDRTNTLSVKGFEILTYSRIIFFINLLCVNIYDVLNSWAFTFYGGILSLSGKNESTESL